MVYEFEGRTEKEAIDRAAEAMGIEKDGFDVEIVETQRSGLFKKGFVKIRVHTDRPVKIAGAGEETGNGEDWGQEQYPGSRSAYGDPEAKDEFEQKLVDFVAGMIRRMGYQAEVSVLFRENRKIGLRIESENSSILIGKKGKNLDALQLLANIYAGRLGRENTRVILDSENYRIHREEALVRLAYTVADRVRESRSSILLEPMNPFERRLIHTTLNDIAEVETKSEGEGLYKQVRVHYRGARN
jgi:spoIIIJ-associated protein